MHLLRTALVLPCFVAACASVPVNETDDPTANFVEVGDGVFRGARPDRAALERLKGMAFRTILNLEDDGAAVEEERVNTERLGLEQVRAPMNAMDNPNTDTIALALSTLADPESRPLFVHCMKGMDRTGAIIALHRVFNEGWTAGEARQEMMDRGFNGILLTLKEFYDKKSGLDD